MERDIDLLYEEMVLDPEYIERKNQQPKKEPLWKIYHREGLKRLNQQQQIWDNLSKQKLIK
jgi:hypothetical protein